MVKDVEEVKLGGQNSRPTEKKNHRNGEEKSVNGRLSKVPRRPGL